MTTSYWEPVKQTFLPSLLSSTKRKKKKKGFSVIFNSSKEKNMFTKYSGY